MGNLFRAAVFLLLAFFPAQGMAAVFNSDCGNLSVALPDGWQKSRQKQLARATLEISDGSTQLALYPFFGVTGLDELGRQLQSDRKMVLDNLQQPSGIGRIPAANSVYYYFSWSGARGLNAMGYLNIGGRFYHLVLREARDFKQVKELMNSITPRPAPAEPVFNGAAVVAGPKDTALAFVINRAEYPQAETAPKILSLTRYDGAVVTLSEEGPEKEGALAALCSKTEPRKKTAPPTEVVFANGWPGCRIAYRDAGGDVLRYYFVTGGLIYSALAGNVPQSAAERLIATGKATSIMAAPDPSAQTAEVSGSSAGGKLPAQGNKLERPLSSLPPLPKRAMGLELKLIIALALVTLGSLLLKLVLPEPDEPPFSVDPNSPYPLRIERRYLTLDTVYEAADAHDRQYTASSPRLPELGAGIGALLFFCLVAAKIALDLTGSPGADMAGRLGLYALSFTILCFVLAALVPKRMYLYDGEMRLVAYAVMRPVFLLQKTFLVYNSEGQQVAFITRPMFRPSRQWYITELNGESRYTMYEDSLGKALLRKLFGHMWGMLRASYVFTDSGEDAGVFRKDWSLLNRYTMFIQNPPEIDYRIILLMGLLADRTDPDRWHPWIN